MILLNLRQCCLFAGVSVFTCRSQVRLSQGDYNTVIQVLAGNFGERANTADVAFHADDVAKEVDTVDCM